MKHNPRILTLRTAEDARREIERIGATPAIAPRMAEKATLRIVRLENVPGKAASILKQEMLARGGECAVAHDVAAFDPSPQPCILLGTMRQYSELSRVLPTQPFGLQELGEELALTLKRYESTPPPLVCHDRQIPIGDHTLVMGIINVTPDSFSGDGIGVDAETAACQAENFARSGADILDIGGESTRPGSEGVTADEELKRVMPCLEAALEHTDLPVSIDTSKPQVAKAALEAGAHIVNDVNALRTEGMTEVVAESGAPVVIMHMLGKPRDMQMDPTYDDFITEVYSFLVERTEAAVSGGITETQIVIDPGFGFGKTVQHNLEMVHRLAEFRSLGRPVLIGPSRKSSIGKVLDKPANERLWGTAATVTASILNGANIVRVHDVEQMVQVARMTDAIMQGWDEDAGS